MIEQDKIIELFDLFNLLNKLMLEKKYLKNILI